MADMKGKADGLGTAVTVEGEDKFLNQLNSLIPQTIEERTEIVEAGAPLVTGHLRKHTPYLQHTQERQNYLFGKIRNPRHIKDSITHKPGQYVDGSTSIGYRAGAYPIARWVNWGTYKQPPQFFFEKAFNSMNYSEVFNAQSERAKSIVRRKGVNIK